MAERYLVRVELLDHVKDLLFDYGMDSVGEISEDVGETLNKLEDLKPVQIGARMLSRFESRTEEERQAYRLEEDY